MELKKTWKSAICTKRSIASQGHLRATIEFEGERKETKH
jgi:hypothetical protein